MGALRAILAGSMIGITGLGVGGVMAIIPGKSSKRAVALWIAFAAGLMLAISLVELLPDALVLGGLWAALIGFEAGVLSVALFMYFVRTLCLENAMAATGILMGGAIAMHNLPEGMAIGAGFSGPQSISIALMITMLLHGVPEGMAMAIPMKASGLSVRRVLRNTALAGLPMGLGAGLGYWLGASSEPWVGGCMAFAAGAMVAVVMRDMLEQAQAARWKAVWLLGAALGTAMSVVW